MFSGLELCICHLHIARQIVNLFAGMTLMVCASFCEEVGNQLRHDCNFNVTWGRVLSVDVISQCSWIKSASTEDTSACQSGHQCRVCPELLELSIKQTLLNVQSHCFIQVGCKNSCKAFDRECPWQKQILSHLNSKHAQLAQCSTCVGESSCVGLRIAVASILGLAYLHQQRMNGL